MYLRKSFVMAALAAAGALAVPSLARADITIQVEEGTVSGGVFTATGPSTIYTGTTFSTQSYTINGGINGTGATLQTTGLPSLGTTLNLGLTAGFTPGDVLQVTVTATNVGNATPGNAAVITNTASASDISNISSTFTVTSVTSVTDTSNNNLATTGPSIATSTYPGSSGGGNTVASNISSLPGDYTITQTITAAFTPTGSGSPSATILGTVGSDIVPAASVPAPGGLALMAIGLPLLGLRRVFRRATA